ncbi:hypothetical protein Kpol_1054p57 [Vanderwaltozyma polyspora DSM 70294]|uniref:Nuclear import protein MOG1 n=1 Tax=Vanderwaltozyma polyspora (strain ATCC 22028 / DSM 70294 / BCRC 21397 / CBS 2163 / NBRC 10782 / NRRL Y-8283 / UCD 57-17) TaxID=436907 RepID=A7TIE3_VANPO|nr:uncharacterized protein Kpol_1054p57 [Vanderwaltozyma polyspora DSM 70294]EDO18009.1 hypothetical protein Kpol_1054p57 [Vanderwaltozyma polyspora DSM 70294]
MFDQTQLYGGAINTVIPKGFLDVSLLREVPDTQEVYVNSRQEGEEFHDGLGRDESIIVDLLQEVEATNELEALQTHINELTTLNDATDCEYFKHDKPTDNSQICILMESAKKWGKPELQENVVICMGLIRLLEYSTDVVITINIPLGKTINEDQDILEHPNIMAAYDLLREMVKQFKVVDPSLFI